MTDQSFDLTTTEGRQAAARHAQQQHVQSWIRFAGRICIGAVLLIVAVVLFFGWVSPKMNLYKANTEKKAVIAEQKAKSEAAEFAAKSKVTQAEAEADAEVARAKGAALAQEIIAQTLTPEYLRYLYINAVAGGDDQIIYVPTEAGLPITEAGRADEGQAAGE